ncbi:unnamed protein product [Clonostachys rhizophaga]|uniref:Uncharacterized protein n=1 Tax=Clonostachys rhizophaga TaxID=160324 RepID=A0A9N9V596_9HYPO|nr:unnamed protein product [Clonostachys rhizophaga]
MSMVSCELREAIGDGLELQERGQLDVDVWVADFGLHDGLYDLGVEDSHGDVLCDDLLVLPTERGFQVLFLEDLVVGISVWVIRWRLGGGWPVCRVGGGGLDCHAEHGDPVALGQAQRGRHAITSRLEGSLKRLERQLQVNVVVLLV